MKKLLILFCIFFISILFSGCEKHEIKTSTLEQSHFKISDINNDVILSIKENSITSETNEITLVYTNRSKAEYLYGGIDYLEVEKDSKWYALPSKEGTEWHMVAYTLKPDGIAESSFSIKTYYGDLAKGKYRIIKTLSQFDNTKIESYTVAEFTVK
jgi:hypothetical protein